MRGRFTLYIDQWGNRFTARTIKELRANIGGGGRVSKMYRDKVSGKSVHCGYVVGAHWCTAYQPVELQPDFTSVLPAEVTRTLPCNQHRRRVSKA